MKIAAPATTRNWSFAGTAGDDGGSNHESPLHRHSDSPYAGMVAGASADAGAADGRGDRPRAGRAGEIERRAEGDFIMTRIEKHFRLKILAEQVRQLQRELIILQ